MAIRHQWNMTDDIILEKGDALLRLSEKGQFQNLYLTEEGSWCSFLLHVAIHVLNNKYILDQCANDFLRHLPPEEVKVFLPMLRKTKYAH